MNVPRYWSRATAEVPRERAGALSLTAWGWSSRDRAEADQLARERLAALVARVREGLELPRGYAYGQRPLREEIVEEIHGTGREALGVITRTSYGSLVLNATRAMFIDVDLPPPAGGRFRRLFGRGPDAAGAARERLRNALTAVTGASFRVYRTAAGFRVLATDPVYEPGSPEAEAIMGAVAADPAFVRLCRLQESFRARLTPKPWRCGQPLPPGRYPRESGSERDAFRQWLAGYERSCESTATCRLLDEIGAGRVHRDVARILRVHDERTVATRELPLA